MKIMSNIQKIFAVLFLLVLAAGCTDEVVDGGGGTTPIEEGKLVNVKFMLDGAQAETVVTKGGDYDDPANPVIKDLLFLQYKKEGGSYELYHTCYIPNQSLTGFGSEATVSGVKLLSGNDYIVYVLANGVYTNVISEDDIYYVGKNNKSNEDENEEELSFQALSEGSRSYNKCKDIGTLKSLEVDALNRAPCGLEAMLAIVKRLSGEANTPASNVFKYTKMLTYLTPSQPADGYFVNQVVSGESSEDAILIEEDASLGGTFYVPYAEVSLSINSEGLNDGVSIGLTSIEIVNCIKVYSLANGFSIAGASLASTQGQVFPIAMLGESENSTTIIKTLSKNDNLYEVGSDSKYWVYENMAGLLDNNGEKGKVPDGFISDNYDDAAKGYTYIRVKGKYKADANSAEQDITYRFILGKDNYRNCNVERNVHYNVTMTLTGDGIGRDGETWRVETNEQPAVPSKEPGVSADLTRLDAHSTLNPITFTNLKTGIYTLKIEEGEGSIKKHGGSLVEVVEGEGVTIGNSDTGNLLTFELSQDLDKVILSYKQESWFDDNSDNEHNKLRPADVAQADCNEYTINVYKGKNQGEMIGKIEIKQYPPVVVSIEALYNEEDEPIGELTIWRDVTYMERFDNDHAFKGKNDGWTIVDLEDLRLEAMRYPARLFDEKDGDRTSEDCYWLNLYGNLVYNNGQNTYTRVRNSDMAWPYSLDNTNKSRYIIQN